MRQVATIYGVSYTTTWNYDALGRLSYMVYPSGFAVFYGYDASGRVSLVQSNLGGTWTTLADSFLHQPATDRRYAWRFGNGRARMVTLDTDGRISQLSSPGVHGLSYGFFVSDTIKTITDGVFAAQNSTFGKDRVDRVRSVSRSGDAQSFTIDQAGNRTSHTRQGQTYTYTRATNSNRLESWSGAGQSRSFGYDAAGKLASESRHDGTRGYGYDPFDRLAGWPASTSTARWRATTATTR